MAITIYGIKNCDTMKKAHAWLTAHGHDYQFHDYKLLGIERERLLSWCIKAGGWQRLLNRAGTTFRKLPESQKADLNETNALQLMLASPSLIKRPVLEHGEHVIVGFDPKVYEIALP